MEMELRGVGCFGPVLGAHYLTNLEPWTDGEPMIFASDLLRDPRSITCHATHARELRLSSMCLRECVFTMWMRLQVVCHTAPGPVMHIFECGRQGRSEALCRGAEQLLGGVFRNLQQTRLLSMTVGLLGLDGLYMRLELGKSI